MGGGDFAADRGGGTDKDGGTDSASAAVSAPPARRMRERMRRGRGQRNEKRKSMKVGKHTPFKRIGSNLASHAFC